MKMRDKVRGEREKREGSWGNYRRFRWINRWDGRVRG